MYESRHERFRRLASARTNAALEKLRLLGNLSSTINYEYTDEEINKIFNTLESQLRIVKARFSAKKQRRFSL